MCLTLAGVQRKSPACNGQGGFPSATKTITGFAPAPCPATAGATPWARQVVHSKNTWGQEVMKQSKAAVVKIFLATAFTLGVGQQSYGQVFKCIENGRNVYSDKPCSGERATMQKGAVSVMPSQSSSYRSPSTSYQYRSPSTSYQSDYSEGAPSVNRGGRGGGTAFAISPSNPTGRPTISKLLPGGGSIADREAFERSQRSQSQPSPTTSIPDSGPKVRRLEKEKAPGKYVDSTGEVWRSKAGTDRLIGQDGQACRVSGSMVRC